jgi:hypothetical protein
MNMVRFAGYEHVAGKQHEMGRTSLQQQLPGQYVSET